MSNIFSLAWKKVNLLTSTLCFLGDLPAVSEVCKSDGLDFKSLCVVGTGCNPEIRLHFLSRFTNLSSRCLTNITDNFTGDQSWWYTFFSIQRLLENERATSSTTFISHRAIGYYTLFTHISWKILLRYVITILVIQ